MSFDHLKKLDIKTGSTAEMTLYEVVGEPTLTLAPATEANKPYFNAFLKRARRLSRNREITVTTLDATRNDDRALFPALVIKGWRGVKDDQGKDVPFSKEAAVEFIQALPDWLFDQVRGFASNAANFTEGDPEENAGN